MADFTWIDHDVIEKMTTVTQRLSIESMKANLAVYQAERDNISERMVVLDGLIADSISQIAAYEADTSRPSAPPDMGTPTQ